MHGSHEKFLKVPSHAVTLDNPTPFMHMPLEDTYVRCTLHVLLPIYILRQARKSTSSEFDQILVRMEHWDAPSCVCASMQWTLFVAKEAILRRCTPHPLYEHAPLHLTLDLLLVNRRRLYIFRRAANAIYSPCKEGRKGVQRSSAGLCDLVPLPL